LLPQSWQLSVCEPDIQQWRSERPESTDFVEKVFVAAREVL
jgi:hypothetical protein